MPLLGLHFRPFALSGLGLRNRIHPGLSLLDSGDTACCRRRHHCRHRCRSLLPVQLLAATAAAASLPLPLSPSPAAPAAAAATFVTRDRCRPLPPSRRDHRRTDPLPLLLLFAAAAASAPLQPLMEAAVASAIAVDATASPAAVDGVFCCRRRRCRRCWPLLWSSLAGPTAAAVASRCCRHAAAAAVDGGRRCCRCCCRPLPANHRPLPPQLPLAALWWGRAIVTGRSLAIFVCPSQSVPVGPITPPPAPSRSPQVAYSWHLAPSL